MNGYSCYGTFHYRLGGLIRTSVRHTVEPLLTSTGHRAGTVAYILFLIVGFIVIATIVFGVLAGIALALERAREYVGENPNVTFSIFVVGLALIVLGYIVAVPGLWILGVVLAGSFLVLAWWDKFA